jgi:hypothetical protein
MNWNCKLSQNLAVLSRELQLTNFDEAEADGHLDATVCNIVCRPAYLPLSRGFISIS